MEPENHPLKKEIVFQTFIFGGVNHLDLLDLLALQVIDPLDMK